MRLRPHHGLCALSFVGKGYDSAFTANMAAILALLDACPEREIELAGRPDGICAACPHLAESLCASEARVRAADKRCLDACGLADGTRVSWREYRQRIRAALHSKGREALCGDCEWLDVCREVLPHGALAGVVTVS